MGQTLADRVLIAKSSDGEMNDLLQGIPPIYPISRADK